MTYYTLAFNVNDKDKFKEDFMTPALDSMRKFDESDPYACYAVSCNDEFGKIEKIEDIIGNSTLSNDDKVRLIESALYD